MADQSTCEEEPDRILDFPVLQPTLSHHLACPSQLIGAAYVGDPVPMKSLSFNFNAFAFAQCPHSEQILSCSLRFCLKNDCPLTLSHCDS